jgi:molybdate transport system permease protein
MKLLRDSRPQSLCIFALAFLTAISVTFPNRAASTESKLKIAAAADLQPAMDELAEQVGRETQIKIDVTYGSSGNFFSQIINGAPFDLFFSADREYPEKLVAAGLVAPGTLNTYALGQLVLWAPANEDIDVAQLQWNSLSDGRVHKIAVANPEHAPYGRAAISALQDSGFYEKVRYKIVYGENVSQAAQFVQSGNAQVGIIPKSLAASPGMKGGNVWDVPRGAFPPIEQAAVILKSSHNIQEARAFVKFIGSNHGRAILARYGFAFPDQETSPRPVQEFQRLSRDESIEALFLSIRLALSVSAILFAVGMPLAYCLAQSRFRGKFLVEAVVALPLVLPPTVIGFYILVAMGPKAPLGRLWQTLFGHGLAFTFGGLVLASIVYSLPFAVQPLVASFESVDQKLLDASAVLGAGKLRTFGRVVVPLSLPGMITAFVLSFAHTLGEFGVVLMVGGNLPGITRTASIEIYDRVQFLDYAGANRLALVLMVASFGVLSIVYGMNRRFGRHIWTPWPAK